MIPYYPRETKHRYTNKSKKPSDFNIIRMYMPFKVQQEFAVDTVESRWANLPGVKKNIQPFIILLLIYNRLQKRTLFAEITHEIISGFLYISQP